MEMQAKPILSKWRVEGRFALRLENGLMILLWLFVSQRGLIEKRGFDPRDQLERYTRWANHGHLSSNGRVFDIGSTVQTALAQFARTHEPFCGSSDPWSAGNGSLMRLAPVPLFYLERPQEAIECSGEQRQFLPTPGVLVTIVIITSSLS